MKKKLLIIFCMMLMSLPLLTACAGDSHTSSDRDWDSDVDLDEDEEEDMEEETSTNSRDAMITLSNKEITCVIEYNSEVAELKLNEAYEPMTPTAFINYETLSEGEVFFSRDLGDEENHSADELYQAHTSFLNEYRTDVWVSDIQKYTTDNGYAYSCFSTRSNWHGMEYANTFICAQITEDTMLVITKDNDTEIYEGSLEEFVESAFYVKEVSSNDSLLPSETPEESASDSTEAKGSITITWNSDAAGNISGQPYDLTVLLSGSSNDGASITCDVDGESYLDAQGNIVASIKKIAEQITIEFYNTDLNYNIIIENATPDNGWAGETTITCNLPGVTEFNQEDHYYRGATGVWYYSFSIENGVLVQSY